MEGIGVVGAFNDLVASRERPIVTAEFPSMDGGDLDTVAEAVDRFQPYVDAVNITDNPAAHALSLPGIAGIHITDFRHDDSVHRLVHDLRPGPAFSTGATTTHAQTA